METPVRIFPNSLLSVLTESSSTNNTRSNGLPGTPISLNGPFQTKSNKNRQREIAARKMVLEMRAYVNQKASELRRLAVTNVITSGCSQEFLNTDLCDILAEMGNPESVEDLVNQMVHLPSTNSTATPSPMPSKIPSKLSKLSQASTVSVSSVESLYGTPSNYPRAGKSSLFNQLHSNKPWTANNSNSPSSSSSSGSSRRLGAPTLGFGLNGQRGLRYPRENSVVPKSRMLPMPKPTGDVLKSAPRTQGLKRSSSSQSVISIVTPNPTAIKKPVRLKIPTGNGNFFHVDMTYVGVGNNAGIKNFDAFVADVHDLISKRNTAQPRFITVTPPLTSSQSGTKNPRKYIRMDSEQQYRQPNNPTK